jgi:hypothetical protein
MDLHKVRRAEPSRDDATYQLNVDGGLFLLRQLVFENDLGYVRVSFYVLSPVAVDAGSFAHPEERVKRWDV